MNHKFEKRVKRIYAMLSCFVLVAVMTVCPAFAADDPLAVVTNLSDFISVSYTHLTLPTTSRV